MAYPNDTSFRHENHYVPKFLLKQFSSAEKAGHLWEYRLLVEDLRLPDWNLRSASALAKTADLYTIVESTDESDRMEHWLDQEFESPAQEAVIDATKDLRLQKSQWRNLIKLYAAQFLRTPAYYVRHKDLWARQMEKIIRESHETLCKELPEKGDIEGDSLTIQGDDDFPLRYTVRRESDTKRSLKIEHVTGRKHWMWAIKTGLRPNGQLASLERYKWSIITAPKDVNWFLTDNPATCIRRLSVREQSFDGGWGNQSSRLMLPLGPKHLLYCQVGNNSLERYFKASPVQAESIRKDLADAALRTFYCKEKDSPLIEYRSRRVDQVRFQVEAAQWKAFAEEHSRAERFE